MRSGRKETTICTEPAVPKRLSGPAARVFTQRNDRRERVYMMPAYKTTNKCDLTFSWM